MMCERPICRVSVALMLALTGAVEASLVGHWQFEGDLQDTAGLTTGTFIGGSPAYVTGHFGQALSFDGVDDYMSLSSPASPSAYTIALWVKPARTSSSNVLLRTSSAGQMTEFSHQLRINGGGVFEHYIWVGTTQLLVGTTVLQPDTWYHVAITAQDNGPMQLFVNGREDTPAIKTLGTLWRGGDRIYVGSNSGWGFGWLKGIVDDLLIYDLILPEDEIQAVMRNEPTMSRKPNPSDGDKAVPDDAVLTWTPGEFAAAHDVYFGTTFDDVNTASRTNPLGVLVSQGQDANTYDPVGLLLVRHTYYWRVDEVKADETMTRRGQVWSFTSYGFDPGHEAVYTTDQDFDLGTLVGVEHETAHDQLCLAKQHVTLPFIWVPNSNEGTVSKVDTRTGREVARYRTGPSSNGNPSRTTVDLLHGNCWVGNRNTGTVVKIGLLENGQYMDRNYNGAIETSTDLDGDGQISGNELLPWASDECVIYEVVLIPGLEGTYVPGQYQGTYANDYWTPGPRGIAVDKADNIWAGCYGTKTYYYIEGDTGKILKKVDVSSANHTPYGAVVDENGILWSSGNDKQHVLWLDPTDLSFQAVGLNHYVYGLAIDEKGHLLVSGWDSGKLSCVDTRTRKVLWTKAGGNGSRGIACTDDGDIWTADTISGLVSRYDNGGNPKRTISVGNQPTGVAVDATGKVWVVCLDGGYIFRIDPSTNKVDLTKTIPGTTHYGYSDMTGIISRTYTAHVGSWKVLHYAGTSPLSLEAVSWTADEPTGAFLDVFLRSTNDRVHWSPWEMICNGRAPRRTTAGRYYEIEAAFEGSREGASPVLYDLTIRPSPSAETQGTGQ